MLSQSDLAKIVRTGHFAGQTPLPQPNNSIKMLQLLYTMQTFELWRQSFHHKLSLFSKHSPTKMHLLYCVCCVMSTSICDTSILIVNRGWQVFARRWKKPFFSDKNLLLPAKTIFARIVIKKNFCWGWLHCNIEDLTVELDSYIQNLFHLSCVSFFSNKMWTLSKCQTYSYTQSNVTVTLQVHYSLAFPRWQHCSLSHRSCRRLTDLQYRY